MSPAKRVSLEVVRQKCKQQPKHPPLIHIAWCQIIAQVLYTIGQRPKKGHKAKCKTLAWKTITTFTFISKKTITTFTFTSTSFEIAMEISSQREISDNILSRWYLKFSSKFYNQKS